MIRIRFIKEGRGRYISHLDLMRTIQRAFIRAGVSLRHTGGFNPRPYLVFAIPLSVGAESECELMDFDTDDGSLDLSALPERLNAVMPEGIKVTEAYEAARKFKEITWLKVDGTFYYDGGAHSETIGNLEEFFKRESIVIPRRTKKGISDADIAPMIKSIEFLAAGDTAVGLTAVIAAQNPSLNPSLLAGALEQLMPGLAPDFAVFRRKEFFDINMESFK